MGSGDCQSQDSVAGESDDAGVNILIDTSLSDASVCEFLEAELNGSACEKFHISECPAIAVVGVGEVGCCLLESAGLVLRRPYITIAVSTDSRVIDGASATRNLLVACDANTAIAESDVSRLAPSCKAEVERLLEGLYVVIFLTGLDSVAEAELSIVIADVLSRRSNPTFALVVNESEIDEGGRLAFSAATVKVLKSKVTALLEVDNGVLEDISEYLDRAVLPVEQFARVVASPAPTSGLIGIDVVDLVSVLSGPGSMVMGSGVGLGGESAKFALEVALNGVLSGGNKLLSASGVMILLEARPSIAIEQFSSLGEVLENFFGADVKIKISCLVIKDLDVDARVTVLARLLS